MKRKFIVFKFKHQIIRIRLKKILHFESEGVYSKVYLKNNECELICMTLKQIEIKLKNTNFIRISRSHLINLKHCEKILTSGKNEIVLNNNLKLKVSKAKMTYLKMRFTNYNN
jgi:DNA-binding LytR/AlgR family response regulator